MVEADVTTDETDVAAAIGGPLGIAANRARKAKKATEATADGSRAARRVPHRQAPRIEDGSSSEGFRIVVNGRRDRVRVVVDSDDGNRVVTMFPVRSE